MNGKVKIVYFVMLYQIMNRTHFDIRNVCETYSCLFIDVNVKLFAIYIFTMNKVPGLKLL